MPPNRKSTVLVVDDDQLTRDMAERILLKRGYQVVQASNGEEAIERFQDYYPDIVLLDAMMPKMDGITACGKIQGLPNGEDTPIVMITALDDASTVDRAFDAGATDYITKPLNWAVVVRRIDRILRTQVAEQALQERLAQLDILRRIDRELGYTLNLDLVLDLAIDSALRWSGAMACGVTWLERETQQLTMLKSIGGSALISGPIHYIQLLKDETLVGRVFSEQQPVQDIHENGQTADIAIPMRVRGTVNGFIILENFPSSILEDESTFEFLVQLANRTAAAIDKARTHDQTQQHALQIDTLYNISTAISSNLVESEIIDLLTRGFAVLLKGTSSYFARYDKRNNSFSVNHRYHADFLVGNQHDTLPDQDASFEIEKFPAYDDGPIQYLRSENDAPHKWRQFFGQDSNILSGLLVPIQYENNQLGLIVINNSQSARIYLSDDINLARSLSAQGATALQQASLFQSIQELEQIKTEMIRMASHDLRNPLGQVTGYFELLMGDLAPHLNSRHERYVSRIAKAVGTIEAILADILNLENIESQTASNFEKIEMMDLLNEVVSTLKDQASQKSQTLEISNGIKSAIVQGSVSQLRQAMNNFVNNAIKYTPEEGKIIILAENKNDEFHFSVKDTGYGIPEDQQDRIFQRFFRAKSAATEHIEGTGLGLSLVKSVIERHRGKVWFESKEGEGSTFGFWLPLVLEEQF